MNVEKQIINNSLILILFLAMGAFVGSCGPKDSESKKQVKMEDVFNEISGDLESHDGHNHGNVTATDAKTKLLVKEVLHSDRYTYLNGVADSGDEFWVAISKNDFNIGDMLAFEDGILKNNFESKEFNRMFETIYLVSKYERLVKISEDGSVPSIEKSENEVKTENSNTSPSKSTTIVNADGSIELSSLLANPRSYKDKSISVYGQVMKVNYNIMGKNWVHIRSQPDDASKDLTITTSEKVMEGEKVKFTGVIRIDKDFGAGYKYDVIMEDAKLVK